MLISDQMVLQAMSFLLGGSTVTGWEPLIIALPYFSVGLTLLVFSGHSLNVLQFGEEQAQQLGLSVERVKLFIIVSALSNSPLTYSLLFHLLYKKEYGNP